MENPSSSENSPDAETGVLPTPSECVSGGDTGARIGGSIGGGGGGDTIDGVDEPWGQIIRIIPGRGLSALLFLPVLPVNPYHINEETGHPGLQMLYLDRAWADDPDTWERWSVFEWNEDWKEYATERGESIRPIFDSSFKNVIYCTASYTSKTIDYRDFYLRATAVTLENGKPMETVFAPALITYPEGSRPSEGETPPSVVNPPEKPAGDSDGNRGDVVPGESERVDPESSPIDLLPSVGQAQAAPSGSGGGGSSAAADGASETSISSGAASSSKEVGKAPTSTSEAASQNETASSESSTSNTGEDTPGFVLAIGATAVVVIVGAAVFACRTRIAEHFGKTRP